MAYDQHDLALVHARGVDAVVRSSFGTEEVPPGPRTVTGLRR
jgi:hypothetical protein